MLRWGRGEGVSSCRVRGLRGLLLRISGCAALCAATLVLAGPAKAIAPIWEWSFGPEVASLSGTDDGVDNSNTFGTFSFPFAGTTYSGPAIISITMNGFISLGGDNGADCCDGNPATMLADPFPRLAPAWTNLDGDMAAAGGLGKVFLATLNDDADAAVDRIAVTWDTGENDCGGLFECFARVQVQLLESGVFVFGYQGIHLNAHDDPMKVNDDLLAGFSPGNGAADPGPRDISAEAPFDTGASSTVYELFTSDPLDVDLDFRSVVFTPNGQGGYRVELGVAPTTTALPSVLGNTQDGATLTAYNGTWIGVPPPSKFTLQWQRCNAAGESCKNVAGATAQTYALGESDVGSTLRVKVVASVAGASAASISPQSGVVLPKALVSTAAPSIARDPQRVEALVASSGAWSGAATFAYEWKRCRAPGGVCTVVAGATAPSYTITAKDAGKTLLVTVTAANAAGSVSASSAALAACTHLGTRAKNTLRGTRAQDLMCALGGNDVIIPKGGRDVVFAGAGNDEIRARRGGGDVIDGGPGKDRGTFDKADKLTSVEARA